MPSLLAYRANSSSTVSASVRARAGLTQQELGDLLGVSGGQVGHVEAGRRGYSARALARLRRLTDLLPRVLPATAPTAPPPARLPPHALLPHLC